MWEDSEQDYEEERRRECLLEDDWIMQETEEVE